MKYQKPINAVQNSDEFSSGLMEAYGKWMGGDCFQNTEPVDIYNLAEAFDGMDPQSHGAEIEKTTTKKKTAKKESPKVQLDTKEELEVLEREEYELDGVTYVIEKLKGVDGKACWKGYKQAGTKMKGGKTVDNCVKAGYEPEGDTIQEKNGLYANIHAKKKRGEAPAKSGSKDYPASDAFEKSAKTAKKEEVDHIDEKKDMPGGQEKIDANKNGKVDAHDFMLLRSKKDKKINKILAMKKK